MSTEAEYNGPRITNEEVSCPNKNMKIGKANDTDILPTELWKLLNDEKYQDVS